MLRARERTPTHFPSVVVTFRFVVESIKELRVALKKLGDDIKLVVIALFGTKNRKKREAMIWLHCHLFHFK
jgi:hypothetical protein